MKGSSTINLSHLWCFNVFLQRGKWVIFETYAFVLYFINTICLSHIFYLFFHRFAISSVLYCYPYWKYSNKHGFQNYKRIYTLSYIVSQFWTDALIVLSHHGMLAFGTLVLHIYMYLNFMCFGKFNTSICLSHNPIILLIVICLRLTWTF